MATSPSQVRADFDRIAALPANGWDHNAHYHAFLLQYIHTRCRAALDVGAGTGEFTRRLADRSDHVLGIDLSPEMVRVARDRSAGYANIEFRTADIMDEPLPVNGFDCIVSIATVHHMALAPALERLSSLLAPGGVLLVLDLYQPQGLRDLLWHALAVPASVALNFVTNGRLRAPAKVRAAWAEHGKHDVYPTLAEVRSAAARLVPGACVRRHLLFRYSLVWTKSDRAI